MHPGLHIHIISGHNTSVPKLPAGHHSVPSKSVSDALPEIPNESESMFSAEESSVAPSSINMLVSAEERELLLARRQHDVPKGTNAI